MRSYLVVSIVIGLANTQRLSGGYGYGEPATTVNSSSTPVPQLFQTKPQLYEGKISQPVHIGTLLTFTIGPKITGSPPLLVQTNPAPHGPGLSYAPNAPLETSQPIAGTTNDKSIFQLLGNYSPYFPNPDGFGVDEYPLPEGARISQVHVLHRHGARYPNQTTGTDTIYFGERLTKAAGTFNATGALSFLNTWKYKLGAEIQTPWGRQEYVTSI